MRLQLAVLLAAALAAAPQEKSITPDLSKAAEGQGWKVEGRKVSAFEADGKKAIRFDKSPGQGIAWSPEVEFAEGTIELDLKGEDRPQQSFVGVAFRVVDEKTHDAVYFRPFNFKTPDDARRIRAVQYVSHPQFPWPKLRQEKPGVFEKAVNPVPDPNGWFHARIVVEKRRVSVFVNDAREPCLVVEELSDRKGGQVGLWVGEGSGGEFANLKVTPAK
ncbi:MAG: family 16 glycoside hydrolase [Gammaproteobacteria bacterium]